MAAEETVTQKRAVHPEEPTAGERAALTEEPETRKRADALKDTESRERADIEEDTEAHERADDNVGPEPSERAEGYQDTETSERPPSQIPTGEIIWAPIPQPLPYKWLVGATPSGHVGLQIVTPLGSFQFILNPADARQMGSALINHSKEADALNPLVVTDKMPAGSPGKSPLAI